MLFMILMIIGATLPAAATAPSHTPVPPATGADGGGAGGPSVAGDGDGSSAGAAVSRSLDNASETTALDMLGLAIPAQLRQAYGRARELLRDALIHNAPHPRPKGKMNTGRGTSAAATGRSSWMQASRLNTVEHCPFAHFEQAKSIGHPHARERAGRELPPDIEHAIKFALSHGAHKMAAFRQRQMSAWNTARGLVRDVNLWIKSNAEQPQHVRIVTHNTNIALLCLISDTVNCDYALGKDFLYGFQMTGHVPDSGVHRPVDRMPEQLLEAQTKQLQDSAYDNLLALQRSVDQQGPSSDPQRRRELTEKTNEQIALGRLTGPFTKEELWSHLYGSGKPKRDSSGRVISPVCCLRFGVQQDGKVRPCEDWKNNGQNAATSLAETVAPISFEEPALIAEAIFQHAQVAGIPPPKLHIAVDDVSAGYNNLPTDREYVMCAWDDDVKAARFYTSRVMMFGSTASVNHFCRLPSLIERLGARLFGTLARAYVDDWVITDFVAAGDSAQQALATIHRDIGIPLAACRHACCNQCNRNPRPDPPPSMPKCKRRRPSQIQELLGVVCDVSQAHTGSVRYSPKPERCAKVLRELEAASQSTLSAKQAERLCGKLQFICNSSIFGGVGRAQTLAFHRRSQSRSMDGRTPCTSEAWTADLESARLFLEMILHRDRLPQRVVEFQDSPPIIVYSDAEGSNFHIGLVAWDPLDPKRIHSANGQCPLWLREHARSLSPDVRNDDDGMINVVEMAGALALLTTFPDLLRGRRVFMYQDNSTAFHCAVTGNCHDAAVRDVGARFHLAAAGLGVGLWVEWVNTKAQLADAPSRIHKWKTHGGTGHEHETLFSNLVTDIRPLVLPAEREWPDQLAFLDQMRDRAGASHTHTHT